MPVLQQHAAADGCVQVHASGPAFAVTAIAAAAVVKRHPAPLPLSSVETAVPDSFCAELWRGVSTGPGSIFRCGFSGNGPGAAILPPPLASVTFPDCRCGALEAALP